MIRIFFVATAAAAVWFRAWEPFAAVSVIGIAATLIGGYPIFKEAFTNVLERKMTMELSMTIALLAALAIGEFFTTLVIIFFVLVAERLEGMTVGRGRRALEDLQDLLPKRATIRRDGTTREVAVADLRAGDDVLVRPGSRIPVDGAVIKGISFVDQAAITGESMPVEKVPGAPVYAGTINQAGALEVRAARIGAETAFGRIIEAVLQSEKSQAPIQKTADRLAGYLVYFALGCAALTYLVTGDARSTISVIIVAGACGVAAGTPLAIVGAIGRAARGGVIVKSGIHLELMSDVDIVLLDKTGTLTFGNPEVTEVLAFPGATPRSVIEAAAIAEGPSEHPLGRAILKKALEQSVPVAEPDHFSYLPGKGIVAVAGGEEIVVGSRALLEERGLDIDDAAARSLDSAQVLVARGRKVLGAIVVADVLRPEATEAVRHVREMGIRTVLLTGDREDIARTVGTQLSVDEVHAGLLPEQKLDRVRSLLAEGKRVVMIGDGINDAPALMEASVGVAMGSGTDIARESANVLLIGNDLVRFVDMLRIARRCRGIIMFNFAGTLAVDGVGVLLAAFGFLNPLVAAFIHVTSELGFILNSARLLPGPARLSRPAPVKAP